MLPKLADRINKISADTIHGASWLTRQATSVLIFAVKESRAETVEQFIEEVTSITSAVARARPGMVSIANYANFFLAQILAAGQQKDLAAFKSYSMAKGQELIKSSRQAFLKAVEYASAIVKDDDTIATELWEFIQAVQGKAQVEITAVEGYKDEAICMALYESSWLNGSTVAVADVEAGALANYQRDLDEALGL